MIIIISSPIDLLTERELKLRALENIFTSYGNGNHIIWMPIELVEHLLNQEGLSAYSQRVLIYLRSAVIETRRIEEQFEFYVEVDFQNKHTYSVLAKRLQLGFALAAKIEALQTPAILTENIADAAFYCKFAEIYLVKKRLASTLRIKLQLLMGGGSTTYVHFKQLVSERRLFICFVDSDRDHPRGALGSTAKRFNSEPQGLQPGYYFEIINCHEVENLIPENILDNVLPSPIRKGLIFEGPETGRFRPFPDHKLGLTVEQARKLDDTHAAEYWSDYYGEEDAVWLCTPMGENILDAAVEFMASRSPHKLSEMLNEIDPMLENIAKMVASWGVGLRHSLP